MALSWRASLLGLVLVACSPHPDDPASGGGPNGNGNGNSDGAPSDRPDSGPGTDGGPDAANPPPEKVLSGDYTVHNEMDQTAIADITKITGTLTIEASGGLAASLPALREVVGSVIVKDNGLASLDLPSLRSAGALDYAQPTRGVGLTTLAFPALKSTRRLKVSGERLRSMGVPLLAGALPEGLEIVKTALPTLSGLEKITSVGSLGFGQNTELTTLAGLSGVMGATGTISITANAKLATLDGLGGITQAASVTILQNPLLKSTDGFQNLARVTGELRLTMNASLPSARFPALTTIDKDLTLWCSGSTSDNGYPTALASVSFPKLVTIVEDLTVMECDALTTPSFPVLGSVRSLEFRGNLVLTDLGLPSLVTISGPNLTSKISYNQALKACLVTKLSAQTGKTIENANNYGVGTCN